MIVSLIFSVASGFVVSKFGNLRSTTIGTTVTSIGFFVLFMFHSTEASVAAVLVLVAVGLALMQIGSVSVVLTSTLKQLENASSYALSFSFINSNTWTFTNSQICTLNIHSNEI
jgi:hypothetical protein